MFHLNSCVQAALTGTPRFHGAHGLIRLECCEGGVMMRLRVRGLPCGTCPDTYCLRVEGGCGCPVLALAEVPAWRGEAALTCFLGGFAPENLIHRCACLCMGDRWDGRVAEGIFKPCRGECAEADDCCRRPVCRPPRPLCPPLFPDFSPRCE